MKNIHLLLIGQRWSPFICTYSSLSGHFCYHCTFDPFSNKFQNVGCISAYSIYHATFLYFISLFSSVLLLLLLFCTAKIYHFHINDMTSICNFNYLRSFYFMLCFIFSLFILSALKCWGLWERMYNRKKKENKAIRKNE